MDLFQRDGQLSGDLPVVVAAEGLQMVAHDVQCRTGVLEAHQLQLQTLGKRLRTDPCRLQGAQDIQGAGQAEQGDVKLRGQLRQGDAEVTVVIQAEDQVVHQLFGGAVQMQALQLPPQKGRKGLFQATGTAHLIERVQIILLHMLVIAVLVVVVLQPLQAAEGMVGLWRGFGGGWRLQIDHRVFFRQVLKVLLQLQRAQLQDLNALKLLLAQLLFLF